MQLIRRASTLLCAAALCSSCSDEPVTIGAPAAGAHPAYDDDSSRLSHCEFVAAPARESRPRPELGAFRAGVASRVLDLPIGAPLGGYGARSTALGGKGESIRLDRRVARFATRFVPSAGAHDAARVDAIAIDAQGEILVLLQTDAVLFTEPALFALEEALAADGSMRGRVIVTASHTHSAPSSWIPSFTLVPGIDRPDRALFERAVAVHAEAAKAALAALEPARIGFAVDTFADPSNAVSHDRRTENDAVVGPDGNTAGKDKDRFAWAMRLDRADGSAMAALLSFPIHGTVGSESNPLSTTDASGAIERALSSALGYPVFHVQGAAGDVSPHITPGRTACPDAARCLDFPGLEQLGAAARDVLAPLVEGVKTEERLAFEVVTRTFYVGHAGVVTRPDGTTLYYPEPGGYVADGEVFDPDGRLRTPLDELNVSGGAALCGEIGHGALFGIAGATGAYSSCEDIERLAPVVGGLYRVPVEQTPFCDTTRTTTSAVRFDTELAGSFLLVTVPGEPTAPFAAYLRGRSPAGADRTLLLGYAQDHVGYVLTAEDWLAGGYEPSINVWGPLEGEMVLDGVLAAASLAWSEEREDPEAGTSRVASFPFPPIEPLSPVVTSAHGTVPASLPSTMFWPDTTQLVADAQPSATVPRAVGAARFVWLGGDPAVDSPRVEVQRQSAGGTFVPLVGSGGEPASTERGAVVLTYTPDPLDAAAPPRHLYAATWQAVPPEPYASASTLRPFSLEPGTYRLVATGRALSPTGSVAYSVASAPFVVTTAPLVGASAKRTASALAIEARLGDAPGLRALRAGSSDGAIPLAGPWTAVITLDDATTQTHLVDPSPDGTALLPLGPDELANAASVEVTDALGNGGVIPVQ